MIWVVPQFQQTFAQAGKALPRRHRFVIVVGTGLRKYWWLFALIVAAVVWLIRRRLARPEVRFRWDRRLLRLPLLGDLLAKVEVARLARTLATLLANGVTLLAGLSIVKDTMTNSVLASALDGVVTRPAQGAGLGRPLIPATDSPAPREADDYGRRGIGPSAGDATARRKWTTEEVQRSKSFLQCRAWCGF